MEQAFKKQAGIIRNLLWPLLFNLILYCLIFFITRRFILTQEFYLNNVGHLFQGDQFASWFKLNQESELGWYLLISCLLLFKYCLLSLFLYSGIYLGGYKGSLRQTMGTVVTAEFIFLLPGILKIVWFSFVNTDFTLLEWLQFAPLSALSLLEESVSPIWVYPLSILNLFELAYVMLIAFLLNLQLNSGFNNALKIVLLSYLPVLFTWCVLVMFFSLSKLQSL